MLLEERRAVREATFIGRQYENRTMLSVPHPHLDAGVGDLLAVRADVLDRRSAGPSGDAREALESRKPVLDRSADDVVPFLARGDGHQDVISRRREIDPGRPHQHHPPGEPLVREHDVAAATQDQHRLAIGVGIADRRDQRLLVVNDHQIIGRPAQTERGVRRERSSGQRDSSRGRRTRLRP